MALACAAGAAVIAIVLLIEDKPWDLIARFGPPKKIPHLVAVYEWWAGAVNALLLLVLGATSRRWCRPAPQAHGSWLPRTPTPAWFWPCVLAAMTVTAWCGLQRISYSVWDDEEKSLRNYMVGKYRRDADGNLKYQKAEWRDAFWNYKAPTNHHLQTLLSKTSHTIWKKFAPASAPHFREPVLRWPLLVAAMASVGMLALLLNRLGLPRAAVVAAFLLALHPWHIRYAVELRGYIFTMLFGPLMLLCLLEAIESGRWRWWLAFAASEFALLYAYPGTLFMLVLANLGGLVALWFRHAPADRAIQVPRLVVVSILAGMVWGQLMAPNIPQLFEYLKTDRALGVLNARWHWNVASHFLTGLPWNNFDEASRGYPELQWIIGNDRIVNALLWGAAGLLFLIGAAVFLARRPAGWLVVAVLLIPAQLVYLSARIKGNYLYEWYVIFALPGLCACAALAADTLVAPLRRGRAGRYVAAVLLAAGVAGYAVFSQPARLWLLAHPLQPIRDAVLLIRPSLDPNDPRQQDILTASLNVHLESYDAHVVAVKDAQHLADLAHQADAENKPLFVVTGNDFAFAQENPDLRNLLTDPRYFERFARLPGFDHTLTQTIWLYRPGSLVGVP